MNFENVYLKHYKKLLIIPLVILVISLIILGVQYSKTGSLINKDVSLQGGVSFTINTDKRYDLNDLKSQIKSKFPGSDIVIRELSDFSTSKKIGLIIDISNIKSDEAKSILSNILGIEFNNSNFSVEEIGAALGASFFRDLVLAVFFSLILMAIVIFIIFRKLIPSIAVMSSIILEMITTLAVLALIDFRISAAGIAALLMVMGYSIDTDVLLTTRVLKRDNGSLFSRIKGSIKTGVTMTLTTIIVSLLIVIFPVSSILTQMFTIILIALLIDLISTWIMNAALLIWYLESKKHET